MKKHQVILILVFALVLLCGVVAAGGYLFLNARRQQAMEGRPLVLVHTPINREQIPLGEGVPIHATARAEEGMSQIELWVDGAFVSIQKTPVEQGVSPLVLVSSWKPPATGEHIFVVRAISAQGVEGQASVVIEVTEEELAQAAGEEEPQGGELPEDEGLEGEPPDEEIPDEETPGEGTPREEPTAEEQSEEELFQVLPVEDRPDGVGDPPALLVLEPDFDLSNLEALLTNDRPGIVLSEASGDPVGLQVEILSLQTEGAYEAVHCYASVAEREPLWYPDTDGDQDTNESFAPLEGNAWDIAEHFSGVLAHLAMWPADQALPVDVTCVGIAGGGTDAIELGRIEVSAIPLVWDGVVRRLTSVGGEGAFAIEYRISQMTTSSSGRAKGIDPTMTTPENLTLDRNSTLHWEYNPRTAPDPDAEAPIDGFRVYLNDTFQWVVPPDARETTLPGQWLHPPCGEEYRFTVTAYYAEGCPADCHESLTSPSNTRTIEGGEVGDPECGRRFSVTFRTLFTGSDLGGDGSTDPGDAGPIYFWLYANDQEIFYDGRGQDRHCQEQGLITEAEYPIGRWTTSTCGGGGVPPILVVNVPDGEGLTVAFNITDADTGDDNPDDLVCIGERIINYDPYWLHSIDVDNPYRTYTLYTSAPADASSTRCSMVIKIQPLDDGPVVRPGDPPPLPALLVESADVNESTGELQIGVRNAGIADWNHDLSVDLIHRETGESVDRRLFQDVFIPKGERLVLSTNRAATERALDFCVVLDPENAVTELWDRYEYGTFEHDAPGPYCPPLPDLVIDEVLYDSEEQLLIMLISNEGVGYIQEGDLDVLVDINDSTEDIVAPSYWWSNVTMRPRSWSRLDWPPPGEGTPITRDRLEGGYCVALDPNDEIAEIDESNNRFCVSSGTWLKVKWTEIRTPIDFLKQQEYAFTVDVWSASGVRRVADWSVEYLIESDSICSLHFGFCTETVTYDTGWFYVLGDETVVIEATAIHGVLHGVTKRTEFTPRNNWGGAERLTDRDGACPHHNYAIKEIRFDSGNWRVFYANCKYQELD